MRSGSGKLLEYFFCLLLGAALTFKLMPTINFIEEFFFGFMVLGRASFTHTAILRTRPGLGDQTLFLEVDGENVWQSTHMVGGDLEENLSWDKSGNVVTLEILKHPFIGYDTESKELIKKQ